MITIELTRPQLKVISSVSKNLVVVWIAAMLATNNLFALLVDYFYAMISLYIAIKAEEALEDS